jgi:hypothetical protein
MVPHNLHALGWMVNQLISPINNVAFLQKINNVVILFRKKRFSFVMFLVIQKNFGGSPHLND